MNVLVGSQQQAIGESDSTPCEFTCCRLPIACLIEIQKQ